MSRAPTSHIRCAHFQASCGMKCSRNLPRLRRSAGSLHDKARAGPSGFCAACFRQRSEEHTSELQSLMRISYAVFCLKKKNKTKTQTKSRIQSNMTNEQIIIHLTHSTQL